MWRGEVFYNKKRVSLYFVLQKPSTVDCKLCNLKKKSQTKGRGRIGCKSNLYHRDNQTN